MGNTDSQYRKPAAQSYDCQYKIVQCERCGIRLFERYELLRRHNREGEFIDYIINSVVSTELNLDSMRDYYEITEAVYQHYCKICEDAKAKTYICINCPDKDLPPV